MAQMTVTNTIHKGQSSCMAVKGRGPHLPLTGFLLSRVSNVAGERGVFSIVKPLLSRETKVPILWQQKLHKMATT